MFDRLAPEWDALVAGDEKCTVFQSVRWVRGMWEMEREGRADLVLVEMRSGAGELVAVAPLCIAGAVPPFGVRVLRFVGDGPSDYNEIPVAPSADERAVMGELAATLRELSSEYDVADLGDLPEGSRVIRHRELLFPEADVCRAELGWPEECVYVPVDRPWGEYLKGTKKAIRREIPRCRRRLEEHGLEIRFEDGSVDPGGSVAALIRLHQHRQRSKLERGLFGSRARRAAFPKIFRELFASGELKIVTLAADGAIRAALAVLYHRSSSYLYCVGGDPGPRLRKFGVGKMVLFLAVEEGFREGKSLVDFTRGGEAYKSGYSSLAKTNRRLIVRRSAVKGFLYRRHVDFLQWAYATPWVKKMYWVLRRPGGAR